MNALVEIHDGGAFANSRDVAMKFGKRHDHVVRDIDDLIRQDVPGFRQTQFIEPQNGQSYRAFDMNRDAFMLLAMGFTGPKALRWKLRYIEAFNAMEDRLRNHPALPDASIRAELEHLRAEIASLRLALPKPRYADKPDRLVLRFIRSRDIMPRGVLSRKVDGRLSPDELDDVCERLEEEGEIEIIRRPSDPVRGGRPGTWYVPV